MSMNLLSRMLLGAGLALMIFAIFKDVSVDGYVNLHKLSQQSNQLMLGGFLFVAGIVAMVAARFRGSDEIGEQGAATPQAVQEQPAQVVQPEFAGELDISSSPYQLFLTRQFSIEKNATLEKYVIGDDVFDTLEDSLFEADRRYQARLSEIRADEEKARREANLLEQRLAVEMLESNKREEAERQKRETQFKKVAVYIAGGAALLGALFLASKIIESIQMNKFVAEMESKERKRSERLNEILSSGRLFGYSIGAEVMNQLSDQLKTPPTTNGNGSGVGIQCVKMGCEPLSEFQVFGDVLLSVRFEFCPTIGNGKLTKVVLWYAHNGPINTHYESLKRGTLSESGVQIVVDSLSLSLVGSEVCQ